MKTTHNGKGIYIIREVAVHFKLTLATVNNLTSEEKLNYFKSGKKFYSNISSQKKTEISHE